MPAKTQEIPRHFGTLAASSRLASSLKCLLQLGGIERQTRSGERRGAYAGRGKGVFAETEHTILVVEDDIFIRLDIAEYLRECCCRVVEAGTAAEAIDVLESNLPVDLVFSDIQMPGDLDGFGLARWIRQRQPGVKVILTSGCVKAAEKASEFVRRGSNPQALRSSAGGRAHSRQGRSWPRTTHYRANIGRSCRPRQTAGTCFSDWNVLKS
ncbi:response regulator [Mesorhizobium sp.]|uniref:response regulator n=1 Tax=Mesorhizobium sp. TaxID=1871066 RepID=UPI0025BF4EF6|nr:response regulator [Mesorhizobium sp.]